MSKFDKTSGLPLAKRAKLGITDAQKQALRAYWSQTNPRPTQRACVDWFQSQFDRQIDRTTVSKILSSKYTHLDMGPAGSNKRVSSPQWPILDQNLAEWVEGHISVGYPITGPLIQYKAAEFWKKIPEYRDLPTPLFSDGWVTRFKQRHSLRYITFHGEAASVPSSIHDDIIPLRIICDQYKHEDIYNMDESGLYWRRMPNGGLSNGKIAGQKRDKTRVSIVVATNATGTDRLPLWLIGTAKTPRALRGVNIPALGCVWRWNKKAWMRHGIMEEWLRSFYRHISKDRRVLLLLDNCSAHTVGFANAPPPPHIRVLFFPANATSVYQPLDQGIIQNIKHHYRKKWIRWMIAILDRGLDPCEKMSLGYTLHWITSVWRYDVSDQTIQNCFFKSAMVDPISNPITQEQNELNTEIGALYDQATKLLGNAHNVMPLGEFLDPLDENEAPELDIYEESHVGEHIYSAPEDAEEEYISGPPLELPSNSDVLGYLQDILLWVGNKEKGTQHHIRQIEGLVDDFTRIQLDEKRQVTLDDMWREA
jgi:hypothetical protein